MQECFRQIPCFLLTYELPISKPLYTSFLLQEPRVTDKRFEIVEVFHGNIVPR